LLRLGEISNLFGFLPLHIVQFLLQLQASLRGTFLMSIDDPSTPVAQLPPLDRSLAKGQTLRVDGTNVVRVPFGVRQPRRSRPARPERWATVVLPFQAGGSTPPPPQAA
jgi:hypothetical protein